MAHDSQALPPTLQPIPLDSMAQGGFCDGSRQPSPPPTLRPIPLDSMAQGRFCGGSRQPSPPSHFATHPIRLYGMGWILRWLKTTKPSLPLCNPSDYILWHGVNYVVAQDNRAFPPINLIIFAIFKPFFFSHTIRNIKGR